MPSSSAYITVKPYNQTCHFTGVISVTHSLSLKVFETSDATELGSFVNGAKNEPDRVTLSVVETDAAHSAAGWARRMLDVLSSVKRQRLLCRVVTPHHTYDNMLLSSVTATQDETSPDGWSGDLTFTECLSVYAQSEVKTDDYASAVKNVGSAAPPKAASGVVSSAADAVTEAAQKAAGSLFSVVLSVASGSPLAQKLAGGGFNPSQVKTVNCVE